MKNINNLTDKFKLLDISKILYQMENAHGIFTKANHAFVT